jgi:hypothetical protein
MKEKQIATITDARADTVIFLIDYELVASIMALVRIDIKTYSQSVLYIVLKVLNFFASVRHLKPLRRDFLRH